MKLIPYKHTSQLCSGFVAVLALLSLMNFAVEPVQAVQAFNSETQAFEIHEITDGLSHPWGMAFPGDGRILVTERSGKLRVVQDGRLLDQAISGLPKLKQLGQGGLLDIALHPDFSSNGLLYLSYAAGSGGRAGTEVLRGRLRGMSLENVEIIFSASPKTTGGRHFGSRLLFDGNQFLYISLGDRGFKPSLCEKQPAQLLKNHLGSLVRIKDDGSIPRGNPFIGVKDAKPEIYTYGNRNMQGMAIHPQTGHIWTHEHGPQGGDEINVMQAGVNYGWPVITHGVNYGSGSKICEGSEKFGMQAPLYTWVPSIAPSGMAFYSGDKLPAWRGNLFIGSLKFGLLVRLVLDGHNVVYEERLLDNRYGRIRDVRQGPDGYLYFLTDSDNGALLRLEEAKP